MAVLDIPGDAARAVATVRQGGVVIMPMDVGYAGIGGCHDALMRFFRAKGRGAHKRNAMLGNLDLHDDLQLLDARAKTMVRALVEDHDLPVAVISAFRQDHPLLRALGEEALAASTDGGTLAMLLNAGRFEAEITRQAAEQGQPLFGSSANATGTGTRFRVEDIQPEIRAAADLVVDYGLQKFHRYRRSSTMIDFRSMEVVRIGSCYEVIADVLKRSFGVELPPDPGLDALPSGHLREAQRAYV
ncbi:Sua5/YciO/YrdC/YwlC family protein [Neoroseomonas rubea]|uniref:Sua5/YciO/YrdC/YwlC family protein n=1 Tax=Neoroseomonas rubea TaxID=2748666 RepID=UPI0018DF7C65|nr:Sua5/YciO/YrdC/YwlC family protein [Roseomonas rubea]